MSSPVDRLRLVGLPGSNIVMAGELSRLSRRGIAEFRIEEPKKQGLGSILYPFDPRLAWLAVQHHRTSARVLWDLYESRATRLEPLYDDLVRAGVADRRPWCWDGARISVEAFGVEEFAAGERQIVGTVKNALIEAAGQRKLLLEVDPEKPDVRVQVRLYEGAIVVSLDLSGRPMHMRGYRMEAGDAPLREDLAALLVMLARYDARTEALFDPMAGSGTIAIEAACLAKGRPVWMSGRKPDAERHPLFGALARPKPLFGDTPPVLFVSEIDRHLRETMERAFVTAGIERDVAIVGGDFRNIEPRVIMEKARERGVERGVIVSNPPYGERMGSPEVLGQLYRDLGEWCWEFKGWRHAFLVANPDFPEAFGGRPRIAKPLRNGPLRGYFYLYES
jgi:23S rRNA G2445 N2-methylase RlmL